MSSGRVFSRSPRHSRARKKLEYSRRYSKRKKLGLNSCKGIKKNGGRCTYSTKKTKYCKIHSK